MKKLIATVLTLMLSLSSATALAAGAIPDHKGTSTDGIEIGTASLNSAVKSYFKLFKKKEVPKIIDLFFSDMLYY